MIQFDTSQFDNFIKEIDSYQKSLEQGIKDFINHLVTHANIQAELEKMIKKTVYDGVDNDWYEQTGRLLEATRLRVENDKLYLYMDDDWLNSQLDDEYSPSKGYDTNSRSGSYAERVENDYVYYNQGNKAHPYRRQGSKYMEKTFNQLKADIKSGKVDSSIILKPLMRRWKN